MTLPSHAVRKVSSLQIIRVYRSCNMYRYWILTTSTKMISI